MALGSIDAHQGGNTPYATIMFQKNESWTLIPVTAENQTVRSLSDLTDGVYRFQLSTIRSECQSAAPREYLGFNNRTCSTALSSRFTSGPILRGPSESMVWREWLVRVKNSTDGEVTVSLQAFVHPDVEEKALCLGYMSSFYGNDRYEGTCATPPYGDGLFLNDTQDDGNQDENSQMWTVRSVDDNNGGSFALLASSKPDQCSRVMGVNDCSSQVVLLDDGMMNNAMGSQSYVSAWKILRDYDLAPPASPTPPPPSPSLSLSPPSPLGHIPGPVIAAPSSTSSGYVDVLVKAPGGDGRCFVTSIVITAVSNSIGAMPQSVEVSAFSPELSTMGVPIPMNVAGYNSIYAIGRCHNGTTATTQRSNGLSVYAFFPGGGQPQFVVANLFASNVGNTKDENSFTKNPITTGSWNALGAPGVLRVSLSGSLGARLINPTSRKSRRSLQSAYVLQISTEMNLPSPEFTSIYAIDYLKEISLSGNALVGVTQGNELNYFANVFSSTVDPNIDCSETFEKVSMSGIAVLAVTADYKLIYTANIVSPSWQIINTTGMDWGCGGEISLSGLGAVVSDTVGALFYTSDITAAQWVSVPISAPYPMVEVSLDGKQLAAVSSDIDPASHNTYYTRDVTAPDWINLKQSLRSISISVP